MTAGTADEIVVAHDRRDDDWQPSSHGLQRIQIDAAFGASGKQRHMRVSQRSRHLAT